MAKTQHVIPYKDGWAVRGEGNERTTSLHETQAGAIEAAREIAKNQHGEIIIHRSDGRIRERDSYGHDPLPPKSLRKVLFPATGVRSKAEISKAVREVVRDSSKQDQASVQRNSKR